MIRNGEGSGEDVEMRLAKTEGLGGWGEILKIFRVSGRWIHSHDFQKRNQRFTKLRPIGNSRKIMQKDIVAAFVITL